jgi:WD40 repeat protein
VWDVTTGEVVEGSFTGHTEWIQSVAFLPDERHIVSCSGDRTIRMWDAAIGQVVGGSSPGQTESVTSVASSLDGHELNISDHVRRQNIRTEDIVKMDKFAINSDGWICGEENELILWVPPLHRPYLFRPNTVWIAGKDRTELDLSDFVHGSNWVTVYVDSLS